MKEDQKNKIPEDILKQLLSVGSGNRLCQWLRLMAGGGLFARRNRF